MSGGTGSSQKQSVRRKKRMVKTIYNGEYEKKAITDQFVENLGEMLEKDQCH